ncbi:MAG: XisI protein [Chloroflexota bacterium]
MDSNKYRNAVKSVIEAYAKLRPSHGKINLDVIFDEKNDRYALMQTGWDRGRRVRGNLIYITIQDQKVHIEYDGIEHGVVDDLVKHGVSEQDIVLSFLSENSLPTVA